MGDEAAILVANHDPVEDASTRAQAAREHA
jgi:hypothetical protein